MLLAWEHPSQTIKTGGDRLRQQSTPASSAANMEKQSLVSTVGGDSERKQSTLNVQLTKEKFTSSDPKMIFHSRPQMTQMKF